MQTTATTTPRRQPRGPLADRAPWLRLTPEDGWLTLALLTVMVYTTIGSIESATPSYAPGLDILTVTTLSGLVLGYLVVQQGRLPSGLVHFVAIVLGSAFAFKETADAVLHGNRGLLLIHVQVWFDQVVVRKNSSSDNVVFLLFLAILSFLLAYITMWLVLRTRRPWLAALANATVLLINLNFYTADRALFFLVLFLLATLLLLVRFTLAENMRRWRGRGLRFSPDLGWDFMQAGAIFAVIVLLMAYLLPAGAANQSLLSTWNSPNNPWQQLQRQFSTVFAGLTGEGPGTGGFGFFGNDITLQGKVVLPKTVILSYTLPVSSTDPLQYLATETFDTYNGTNRWTNALTQSESYRANDVEPPSPGVDPATLTTNTYDIVFAVPQGDHLFVPGSEAQQFNVAADVSANSASGVPVAWNSVSPLPGGMHEIATGYVSTASRQQLEQVPYPNALDSAPRAVIYPPDLLNEYLPPTASYAPQIEQAAQDAVRGTTNMYDAAEHLETYLHVFKYSTDNPDPPAGEDAIVWFLQYKQGFCTFFASAMALMARALGMPARIATGFTHGSYDSTTNKWIVRGTDAHVWTQIYFGKYGWINFEPTSSFASFSRGSALPSGGATPTTTGNNGAQVTPTPRGGGGPALPSIGPGAGHRSGAETVLLDTGLGALLLIIIGLALVFLFATWWRLLYRGLSPITAAFARVARLGAWAGAPPSRAQTPDEYAERLGTVVPGQHGTLRRLSDLYARERWGGGLEQEQAEQIPVLYEEVRRSIVPIIVQRARTLPLAVLRWRPRRRSQRQID
jgi:transglutaminase-like putative cysteine protease